MRAARRSPRLAALARGAVAAAIATAAIAASAPAAAWASPIEIGPKVVNGRPALPDEVTRLAYVRAGGYACGGTLAGPQAVITAGHCVTTPGGGVMSPDVIRVGLTPSSGARPPADLVVTRVDRHPLYDVPADTYSHDIAVLTLAAPVTSVDPMPVASPTAGQQLLAAGSTVFSAGFGVTRAWGASTSTIALLAELTAVPNRVCRGEGTYQIGRVTFRMPADTGADIDTRTAVCAIGAVPDTDLIIDTCQGDSGGPLFSSRDGRQVLLGVVSLGIGCAGFDEDGDALDPKSPGIYTRATAAEFRDWLVAAGVTVEPEPAPATPTLSATGGAGSITVKVAPGDAASVSRYTVTATAPGAPAGTCPVEGASGTCTITGLSAATTYSVAAVAIGPGGESAPATATARTASAPSRPTITGTAQRANGLTRVFVTPGRSPVIPARTTVTCSSRLSAVRGAVARGHVDLRLKSSVAYSCRATTTNAVGSTTSEPLRVAPVGTSGASPAAFLTRLP